MYNNTIFYLNEIGNKKNQEDYIWPPAGTADGDSRVFLVCDGVGGSENGEIASKIIADSAGNQFTNYREKISPDEALAVLKKAQKELNAHAADKLLNADMATTVTLLILLPGKALIGWCGDSRVYHLRKGKILFRTEDHSLVNNLVKKGELTDDEAKQHIKKNVILKAVTADGSPVEAEFHMIEEVIDGDYFLLCTDGLLENVTDKDICNLLDTENNANPDFAEYFRNKCEGKTRDNYSAYLLEINEPVKTAGKTTRKKKQLWIVLFLILCAVIPISFYVRSSVLDKPGIDNKIPVVVKDTTPSKEVIQNKTLDTLPELEVISNDSLHALTKQNEVPSVKVDTATDSKKAKKSAHTIPVKKNH